MMYKIWETHAHALDTCTPMCPTCTHVRMACDHTCQVKKMNACKWECHTCTWMRLEDAHIGQDLRVIGHPYNTMYIYAWPSIHSYIEGTILLWLGYAHIAPKKDIYDFWIRIKAR